MIKKVFVFLIFLSTLFAKQAIKQSEKPALSLEESILKALIHYPLHKNQKLIDEALDLNLNRLNKNFIPHLKFGAKASYQSDVTKLPFTLPSALNINYEEMKKDQLYRAFTAFA